jgi:hypothetical protein
VMLLNHEAMQSHCTRQNRQMGKSHLHIGDTQQ